MDYPEPLRFPRQGRPDSIGMGGRNASEYAVLRHKRLHWETLKKILEHSEPPGYRLKEPRPKPKIDLYLERIGQIIQQDKTLPKKQRHTAKH